MNDSGRLGREELEHLFEGGGLAAREGRVSLAATNDEFRGYVAELALGLLRRREWILSVGAGEGALEAEIRRRGARVLPLDLRPRAAAACRAAGLAFVQGDAHALPFPAGVFGGVLLSESIGQVDPAAALAEAARVLKPRGGLLLTTYHLADPEPGEALRLPFPFAGETHWHAAPSQVKRAMEYRASANYRLYPKELLAAWIERSGFRTTRHEILRATVAEGSIEMILIRARRVRPAG